MQKKMMCWGCCNRFDLIDLTFFPVPGKPGHVLGTCEKCAPAFDGFGPSLHYVPAQEVAA